MREEADEDDVIQKVFPRFAVASVDVDGVRHGLKCVEADTDRQENPHRIEVGLNTECGESGNDVLDEEIDVLEVAQETQIPAHADNQEYPSLTGVAFHAEPHEIVENR